MPHGINVGGATPLVLLSLHNRAVLLVTRQKIACNDVSNGLSNTFILNELNSLRGSVLNEVGKCEGFRQSNLFDTLVHLEDVYANRDCSHCKENGWQSSLVPKHQRGFPTLF